MNLGDDLVEESRPIEQEELPLEELKRRLYNKFSLEEDEINSLFKSENELREFYENSCKVARRSVELSDWDSEDSYQLTEIDKKKLEILRVKAKLQARARKLDDFQEQKLRFELDKIQQGKNAPDVSWADYLKTMVDGLKGKK
jgi:hypothetical protein